MSYPKKINWRKVNLCRSHQKLFEIIIFLITYLILVSFIVVFSPVYAENTRDNGSDSFDNLTIKLELNASSYQAQNISEFSLSTNSKIIADTIPISTLLNSNITGTESILSTVTSETDQGVSAIWNDRVVWRSIFADPAIPQSYLSDIFLYNISTGDCNRIISNLSALALPDIWEDCIVWSTSKNGNFEIYLYNISISETVRITNDSYHQVKPRIWGDQIVWQQGLDSDPETAVYLYNLSTGLTVQLDDGSGTAMSPVIFEDRIVWHDGRNGNYDIYLYNSTTGIESPITVDPMDQTNPSIWEDSIVWEDFRGSYYQIYLYNVTSGNETQITFGEGHQINPKIFGNFVVYINQSGIVGTDLPSMNVRQISSGDPDTVELDPDIWSNRITWTDNRNGNYDIFLFTIGIEMPPLLVNFTQNTTQGEYPLSVGFTDTSSGQIDGWLWDFGDGNSSKEQTPFHTFKTPGSYSVILNIHNQCQRNGTRKQDLISVGSVPVPQFYTNQTSGPAPLVIQFTDESSGLPNEWKWEFGDGQLSHVQNPLHTYERSGVFYVCLTASNIYGNATLVKQELISVMDATSQNCILPTEGIKINNTSSGPLLELNTKMSGNCNFHPEINPESILCFPEEESGIGQLSFISRNGTGFSYSDNVTLTGPLSKVIVSSCDLVPMNFSQKVGNNSRFNFTVSLPNYPEEGKIHIVTWEGSTPADLQTFNHICSDNKFARVDDLAYTLRFTGENIDNESAILILGVNPDWVEQYGWRWCHSLDSNPSGAEVFVDGEYVGFTPLCVGDGLSPGNHMVVVRKSDYNDKIFQIKLDDKRDSIHVIRIGDDGSGEVLNTTFIGHDPVRNLDFFRAESPNGLSTFGLASLSKGGNIFQLIQLLAIKFTGSGSRSPIHNHPPPGNTPTQEITSVPTSGQTQPGTGTETPSHFSPLPTASPTLKEEPGEPAPLPTSDAQVSPSPSPPQWLPQTLKILENLSIIFVVIFVTVLFYLRWKRKEE